MAKLTKKHKDNIPISERTLEKEDLSETDYKNYLTLEQELIKRTLKKMRKK